MGPSLAFVLLTARLGAPLFKLDFDVLLPPTHIAVNGRLVLRMAEVKTAPTDSMQAVKQLTFRANVAVAVCAAASTCSGHPTVGLHRGEAEGMVALLQPLRQQQRGALLSRLGDIRLREDWHVESVLRIEFAVIGSNLAGRAR